MKTEIDFSDGTKVVVVKHGKEPRTVAITGKCVVKETPGGVLITFVSVATTNDPTPPATNDHNLRDIVRKETERVEKELIVRALEKAGGVVTQAARALKISRKSLQLKMRDFGIR